MNEGICLEEVPNGRKHFEGKSCWNSIVLFLYLAKLALKSMSGHRRWTFSSIGVGLLKDRFSLTSHSSPLPAFGTFVIVVTGFLMRPLPMVVPNKFSTIKAIGRVGVDDFACLLCYVFVT
ncbi:hypothetical protein V6N13_130686 [Hibiscus sabdariffa]|uniref:Uncharacterized protein n=1 Tax=Hibiscus sabdariffa TaxID=183260 RepID=A0ABR2BPU8_9ROSI